MKTNQEIKMFDATTIIDDMCFDDERFEELENGFDLNPGDPRSVGEIIEECRKLKIPCCALEKYLAEHEAKKVGVSDDDIKSVFLKLKHYKKEPRGRFDREGTFYPDSLELIEEKEGVRCYYYAARTAKFVKLLAHKYRVQTVAELEYVAFANDGDDDN